jgi:2-succinyl-5-enolpyruvyl-6-hydroxy-3-cyclohexene-1-carboxylate synthase
MQQVPTLFVAPSGGDPSRRNVPLQEIAKLATGRLDRRWGELWSEAETIARRVLDEELDGAQDLTEPRVARDLWLAIPEGGLLAVGSSMPVRDLDWFAPSRTGLRVISNRGASGIDGSVSLACGGAAVIEPAFALIGDLALLHDSNGFLTKPRSALTIVVINNRGGGIFSLLPPARFPEHFERVFATPVDVNLGMLAEAHGLDHRAVATAAELAEALREPPGATRLVEVRTDRGENASLHRRLTQSVIEQVSAIPALKASQRA